MSAKQAPAKDDITHPVLETKETLESVLLHIRVPGFAQEHIKAQYESAYRRVRVSGRRPLGNNKWSSFEEIYPIPENCDVNRIRRKFEGETITIILPKKVISRATPKDQPKPTEQVVAKPPTDATETKPEKAREAAPPKSAAGVEEENNDQKGKDGASKESKSTIDSQKQAEDKKAETSPEPTNDSLSEKGQGGIFPQKGELTTDSRSQADEKLAESITKNGETQRFEKQEERKDDGKSYEPGKPTEKAVVKGSAEKESKGEESKESSTMVGESSGLNTATEKGKKELNIDKSGGVDGLGKRKDLTEAKEKGIKELAASASQAITRLVERFNEEDMQKMIYMGAAVAVIAALGVYASYKLRSSARP